MGGSERVTAGGTVGVRADNMGIRHLVAMPGGAGSGGQQADVCDGWPTSRECN